MLLAGCGMNKSDSSASKSPSVDMSVSKLHGPAPDFTLADQSGSPISLHQFRGKVVILAFVDSECTTVCPLTTQSMVEAKRLLGPAQDQVQLLGIDANPTATAISDVNGYSEAHGLSNAWHFLTGTLPQLKAVWKSYFIQVQIQSGAIDHTPALYVIDPNGVERYLYLTPMQYDSLPQEAEILAQDVSGLIPSHPHPLPIRTASGSSALPAQLPVIGGTWAGSDLALKSTKPRLDLFWATWVPDASHNLKALNQYATDAQRSRLPSLDAIDVAPTEPSTDSGSALLGQAGYLLYPVVVDSNGKVADTDSVQDLPWFTLTGARGQVLWHHDGWLSVPQLEQLVKKALHIP